MTIWKGKRPNKIERLKRALDGNPVKKYDMLKLENLDEEWVKSIPKTINDNHCWIPSKWKPSSNGYVRISLGAVDHFLLHRLVVCIYYGLDYYDHSFSALHSIGCDKACFRIKHLRPGSDSDNQKDSVIEGTHHHSKKKICPQCGNEYRTLIIKTGWTKGTIRRICDVCVKVNDLKRLARQR